MAETILVCTVGGSHQPIVTAIAECRPQFTLFVCSGRDPATGRPGSIATVTGKGTPIEARRGNEVERLENLPTLTHLDADTWHAIEVPADDLDASFGRIVAELEELHRRFPEARVVADYTGGTKTMSAALATAALEFPGILLQVVTGTRADLIKVHDGSQSGLTIGAEGIRLRRAMKPYLDTWRRFAYGEAAEGLGALALPRDAALRAELQIAKSLSVAFDAWDRFDHRTALDGLEVYRPRIGASAGALFNAANALTASSEDPRRAPAQLWDLWLNAQRRAAQSRYDDAVSRLYRLVEWTAQWLLKMRGIDTSNLRPDQVPPHLSISPGASGRRVAALRDAWEMAAHHCGDAVSAFMARERDRLLDHLLRRNASILAHGETPIRRQDWDAFSGWVETALIPLLREEAARAGLKALAPQLPDAPLWRATSAGPAQEGQRSR